MLTELILQTLNWLISTRNQTLCNALPVTRKLENQLLSPALNSVYILFSTLWVMLKSIS